MLKTLKDIIFSLYLLISSIVFSVLITLNISPLIYYILIKFNKIPKFNNISCYELLKDYKNIITYLNSSNIDRLTFENFKMSAIGEFHFLEVKEIFSSLYLLGLSSLILCLLIFTFLKVFKLKISLRGFNLFFYEVLFLACFLIISFYLNFSKMFTLFHRIFFNNDYWIFDPKKDEIINVLPEEYFLLLSLFTLILVISFSIISKVFYTLKKRKK